MSPAVSLFSLIGKHVQESGLEVIWICESKIPLYKYNLTLDGTVYFYTQHKKIDCDATGSTKLMFSNFDRDSELGLQRDHSHYNADRAKDLLCFFSQLHEMHKFDGILYENVSNGFSYCAYTVSEQKNFKYFGLIGSRLPGRYEIWEKPFGISEEIEANIAGELNPESSSFAEDYIKNKKKPDYMKNNPTGFAYSYLTHYLKKIKFLRDFLKTASSRDVLKESRRAFQSHHPLVDSTIRLKRNILRKIKLPLIQNKYKKPDPSENYFLYPLHYHPESSTSVLSPCYVDEINTIKNIAFNLPLNTILYIKDHPNAAGFKPYTFYTELSSIPNTRLISYNENTLFLIKKSQGVITLTSTIGFEALLEGIPVYALGDVFYSNHPLCTKIKDFRDLPDAIEKKILPEKEDIKKYNTTYVAAYYKATYPGTFTLETNTKASQTLIKNICNAIIYRLSAT